MSTRVPGPCPLPPPHTQGTCNSVRNLGVSLVGGACLILVWLIILFAVLVLVRLPNYDHRANATALDWFEVFYRTGSIIYGGVWVGGWVGRV